jgi:hypothetical protein
MYLVQAHILINSQFRRFYKIVMLNMYVQHTQTGKTIPNDHKIYQTHQAYVHM